MVLIPIMFKIYLLIVLYPLEIWKRAAGESGGRERRERAAGESGGRERRERAADRAASGERR
jgi:hypothetical protein